MSNYHDNYGTASESDSLLKDDDDNDDDSRNPTYLRPKGTNNTNKNYRTNSELIAQSYSESTQDPLLVKSNSNHSFSILHSHPKYLNTEQSIDGLLALSSNEDMMHRSTNGGSGASIDYETLLTHALENTTRKVDQDNRRKQNILLTIILCIFLFSIFILSTVTFSEYPEEKELKNEIKSLEGEINQLHGEVDSFEKDEDVDLLRKDIDDKKTFIEKLEKDNNIPPSEKEELIKSYQDQIKDLKIVVDELEANKPKNQNHSTNNGIPIDNNAGT